MTTTILGLSGSLRAASTNSAILRTAQDLVASTDLGQREGGPAEIVIHDLRALPMYDGDLEAAGMPPAVRDLRESIAAADGLLIATPEYNWSVPALLKNAIDWASRAPDSPLTAKPTALMSGAGGGGGARVQAHLREVMVHNRVDVIEESLQVPRSRDHIMDGRLHTPEMVAKMREVLDALLSRTAEHRRSQAAAE